MSNNVFTLDSLRAETEKKFAPVKIGLSDGTEVILSSVLRLDESKRKAVSEALSDMNELSTEDESPEAVELALESLSKVVSNIADKPRELLKELKHEDPVVQLHLMTKVVNVWSKETQLGEA